MMKQSLNGEAPMKYNVGYKVQDSSTTKVKKEYGSNEYQNLFSPNTNKRSPYNSADFASFDESYTTTASPNIVSYPYSGQLKLNNNGDNLYTQSSSKTYAPATASNKVFIHHGHHDEPHHFVHDVVEHYITDVAGHKLKHVGEALESGELTEPIIHKLSFAKAALLQLLAIIGPLSAIKTIHVVAKASDPHHHHHEGGHIDGISAPASPIPSEHEEPHSHHHYSPTLAGIILHFVAQLSKFNTEAKLHLIPNLLKLVSYASSSSAHSSAHHPH